MAGDSGALNTNFPREPGEPLTKQQTRNNDMAFKDLVLTRTGRTASRELRYGVWKDPKSGASKIKLMVPLALLEECAKLMSQPVRGIKLQVDAEAGRGRVAALIQADSGGTAKAFKCPEKGGTFSANYPLEDELAAIFPAVTTVTNLANATATKMGIEFDLPGSGKKRKA